MEKTADWTDVQETVTNSLLQKGVVLVKEADCILAYL